MIDLRRDQRVVVGRRDGWRSGHAGNRSDLKKERRIDQNVLTLAEMLDRAKEEEFVSDDVAAERAAKLFTIEIRFGIARRLLLEEVARAQILIAIGDEA